MVKVALLVGVSEYQADLGPLPGAIRDTVAMQQALQQQGNFDQIQVLENPDPLEFQEAVEVMFSGRKKDDLALVFFSGHGIKDDSGRLYFATRLTRKSAKGDLVKATAVPAAFLHDIMGNSRCKRQVVILDCCFSGAFAEGMQAKDDGTVDVKAQLGGEGRAVLTSSSSTQYSFEQAEERLSVYTRFIVEGIQTGAADTDNDGLISIDELHEYASAKVQEVAPAMKPKIYAVEEGFKIRLTEAPTNDPRLQYRKEAEQFASRGVISAIGRSTLDILRSQLNLSGDEAAAIEAEVLRPYQEYQQRLKQYESAFAQAAERKQPITRITRNELDRFQEVLGLEDRDVAPIESKFESPTPLSKKETTPAPKRPQPPPPSPVPLEVAPVAPQRQSSRPQSSKLPWLVGGIAIVGVLLGAIALSQFLGSPPLEIDELEPIEAGEPLDEETLEQTLSETEEPSPDTINTEEGNLFIPLVPGAQTYTHPDGLYTVSLPRGYGPELRDDDNDDDSLFFGSPHDDFEGIIITTAVGRDKLSSTELRAYVENSTDLVDFEEIRFLQKNSCKPRNQNYVCLVWQSKNDGEQFQGESIATQVEDTVFIIHLYDFDPKLKPHILIADHIVGTFSPLANRVRTHHSDQQQL